jgi:hypothetical protein
MIDYVAQLGLHRLKVVVLVPVGSNLGWLRLIAPYNSLNILLLSVDPGYPQGAPLPAIPNSKFSDDFPTIIERCWWGRTRIWGVTSPQTPPLGEAQTPPPNPLQRVDLWGSSLVSCGFPRID